MNFSAHSVDLEYCQSFYRRHAGFLRNNCPSGVFRTIYSWIQTFVRNFIFLFQERYRVLGSSILTGNENSGIYTCIVLTPINVENRLTYGAAK